MDQCPKQEEGILVVLLRLGGIPSDITSEYLKFPQELGSVASKLTTHTCPPLRPPWCPPLLMKQTTVCDPSQSFILRCQLSSASIQPCPGKLCCPYAGHGSEFCRMELLGLHPWHVPICSSVLLALEPSPAFVPSTWEPRPAKRADSLLHVFLDQLEVYNTDVTCMQESGKEKRSE